MKPTIWMGAWVRSGTWTVLLVMGLCSEAAAGSERLRHCVDPPFGAGEMVQFDVHWGPLKVGEGVGLLESVDELPWPFPMGLHRWDQPIWRSRGRGISTGVVGLLYDVDDRLESWMLQGTFQPLFQELTVREPNERGIRQVTFDVASGQAWYWRDRTFYRRRPDKEKVTTWQDPLTVGALGPVGAFLYLRCLPFQWQGTYRLTVHEDGKNVTLEVEIEALETRDTIWGERQATRARIRILHEGKPKFKRPFRAWLTADEQRIPLGFEVDLPFADLKGELVGYRRSLHTSIVGDLDPTFLGDLSSSP